MNEQQRTGAILAIGDELILGQKTDTNSAWIADRMTQRSVRIVEHATVDDDEALIARAMRPDNSALYEFEFVAFELVEAGVRCT